MMFCVSAKPGRRCRSPAFKNRQPRILARPPLRSRVAIGGRGHAPYPDAMEVVRAKLPDQSHTSSPYKDDQMPPRVPDVDPARLALWSAEHLGSPAAAELFRAGTSWRARSAQRSCCGYRARGVPDRTAAGGQSQSLTNKPKAPDLERSTSRPSAMIPDKEEVSAISGSADLASQCHSSLLGRFLVPTGRTARRSLSVP